MKNNVMRQVEKWLEVINSSSKKVNRVSYEYNDGTKAEVVYAWDEDGRVTGYSISGYYADGTATEHTNIEVSVDYDSDGNAVRLSAWDHRGNLTTVDDSGVSVDGEEDVTALSISDLLGAAS